MADETISASAGQLARWALAAALMVFAVGLYFWAAPDREPLVKPAVEQSR
ncbi:MAG: hypothetical protein ACOY71_10005 [Gemmatimonadota bacterium]